MVQTLDRILPPMAVEQVSEGSEAIIRWVENRHFYTKCGYILHPILLIGIAFQGFAWRFDNPYIDYEQ